MEGTEKLAEDLALTKEVEERLMSAIKQYRWIEDSPTRSALLEHSTNIAKESFQALGFHVSVNSVEEDVLRFTISRNIDIKLRFEGCPVGDE